MEANSTRCCVAAGGPCMMLGFLLARAGVEVVVLEKHADFLRDFRGDTIHPSTLEIMHELRIPDGFLRLPHQEARVLNAQFGETSMTFADFTRLPTHCKFLAFMPQWNFLNFIAQRATDYPAFHLRMNAEVTDLIEEAGRIARVRGQYLQRSARGSRESDRRRRWPKLAGTREGRPESGRVWRPDGRAVGAATARPWRPRRNRGPYRRGPHLHHDKSRRRMAVGFRDTQGDDRAGPRAGNAGISGENNQARAVSSLPCR